MVANILIAIGFFFVGIVAGVCMTIKAYKDALDQYKKSDGKHLIVYEF